MRELVFNEPIWSGSGLPISDDELLENCACTGEEPLVPPVLNFSNEGSGVAAGSEFDLGSPLICPTLNFSEPIPHSFDRSGISPVVRGGSPSADSQYGGLPPRADFNDDYENRQDANNRENQRRLGLLDEGEPLTPPSMMAAIIADSRARSRR